MSITSLISAASLIREPHENSDYWYPSEIGGCERKAILRRAGVEPAVLDNRTARVFWMGSRIHEALQEAISSPGVYHEVPYKNEEWKVSGRHDSLRKIENYWETIEFKSIRSAGFTHNLPKPEHILQVGCGLTFRTYIEEQWILPTQCRLVYWSKDSAEIKEFVLIGGDVLKQAVLERIKNLEDFFQKYKKDGSLPSVPLRVPDGNKVYLTSGKWGKKGSPKLKENWQISYCSYKGTGQCCGD